MMAMKPSRVLELPPCGIVSCLRNKVLNESLSPIQGIELPLGHLTGLLKDKELICPQHNST